MKWGQKKTARVTGGGLWSIVSAFRADRKAKDAGDATGRRSSRKSRSRVANAYTLSTAILKEHGYPEEHIREALAACGPDLPRCVAYCLQKATEDVEPASVQAALTEEEWASNMIQSLGFDVNKATLTLEECDFSFSKALLLLLYGNDKARMQYLGTSRFRSHTVRKTKILGLRESRWQFGP